jgi:DnaJ-class molecular chaperone
MKLGDVDKRKAFDSGEIDAEGKPRFQGFEGFGAQPGAGAGGRFGREGGFETFSFGPDGVRSSGGRAGARGFAGFEDILKDVFGARAGAGRGARAGGSVHFEPDDLGDAHGRDITASLAITLPGGCQGREKTGPAADRQGGRVKIPAGLDEGQQIRLKGQGLPGAGGPAGDLLITVAVTPHPLFQRDGADLRLDLPVTLYEAVLGAKVRVPTLDGTVELAIPAGNNSGRTFRLKGNGLPTKECKNDLLATVGLVFPASNES